MLPLAWVIWLTLAWGLLRARRMMAMAGGGGPGMARKGRWSAGVAVVLMMLAGAGIYQGGKVDREHYWSRKFARLYLDDGLLMNSRAGVRWLQVEKMTALAEEREARLGYPPIPRERKEAFLKATAGLPKAGVRVRGMRAKGAAGVEAKQEEADTLRERKVQALIYQAGYRGRTPGMEPEEVMRPLLEALGESGIAPDAKFSPAKSWSDVAFEMVLDSVPVGK